jgi:hypothetical protein
MSHEADSFIDEVSEEVRRDRLYRTMRRYGWIAVLVVVLIVGGATWNEIRKANARTSAEALGDEIMSAMEMPDTASRISALSEIESDGTAGKAGEVVTMLLAAEEIAQDNAAAAVEALRPIAEDADLPALYTDLAALKIAMIGGDAVGPDLRTRLLERVARPGGPYRPLALEQQVIDLAAAGRTDEAIAAAEALMQEPILMQGLRLRVTQLMVTLGVQPGGPAG